jgi:glycolate oxidase FAD binding subunit
VSSELQSLQLQIRAAAANRLPLRIRGGGSKDFYGGTLQGELLHTRGLEGIVDYEPTELVVTARAGTLLTDLERALAERGQLLPFEPPNFHGRATLGGAVAGGLSGPRRAYSGAVRDFVLGVRMLDGRGDELRFGGQVIKNVAGFDVSRLMAGSLGTLGVLTEVSLKTLPRPAMECTLRFVVNQTQALLCMNQWAGRPLPLSASAWADGQLHVRLSGAAAAIRAARKTLGGEVVNGAEEFWSGLREQDTEFFTTAVELWRLSVPSHTPALGVDAPVLIEWGGALRWLRGPLDGAVLHATAAQSGGHAVLYRAAVKPQEGVFQPMAPALASLHQRLKRVFDPDAIFNRGRLYPNL